MRRLCRSKLIIRDRLHVRCEEIEDLIKKATVADCRIHVLDDRKTNADASWIAVIRHHDFKGSILQDVTEEFSRQWRIGRRFIVWAVDRERAIDKINVVYPNGSGFIVASFESYSEA